MARPPRSTAVPMREGVSASCLVLPHRPRAQAAAPAELLLLDYLSTRLPALTRAQWLARLQAGLVCDDQAQPLAPHQPYIDGLRVYYWRALDDEPQVPFDEHILFQDKHLLVADKPHFLPVLPTGRYVQQSLLVRLKRRTGLDSLVPLHRLDRETAGLVVFAVRPQDRNAYQTLFRDRQMDKHYEAVAAPPPGGSVCPTEWHTRRSRIAPDPAAFFRQIEVDGEPNSETRWRCLGPARTHGLACYGLSPITGKTHQLRVHMAGLGLPLWGDQFYPSVQRGPHEPENFQQPLQLLARALAFTDPVTGQTRQFESQRDLVMA